MIMEIIKQEVDRARMSFDDMTTYHEGIAVIREEYLELERIVFSKTQAREDMRKEAIQLAAMCVRFIEDLL